MGEPTRPRRRSLALIGGAFTRLWPRGSLLARFTVISAAATVLAAAGFSWLLTRQMTGNAVDEAAREAARIVTAFITPQATGEDFAAPTPPRVAAWRRRIDRVVGTSAVVRIKVWNARGQVVYSDDPSLIGRVFSLEEQPELREALRGRRVGGVSGLRKPEQATERAYGRLLEVYVPVVLPGRAGVAGAYEVYYSFAPVQARIAAIRRLVWGGSAAAFGLLYLALFALVGGASRRLVRQQAMLRASEEKYRTILENIEDGYFEVDRAGTLTFFNEALCRLLGYPKDEMPGMTYRRCMDEENARKVHRAFTRIYATGSPARGVEWEIITREGMRRSVEASVSVVRDGAGTPVGFRGVARDVTRRRQAEEGVRATRARFQALFESLPDGIVVVDREGRIAQVNAQVERMFGYSPGELLGAPVEVLIPERFRPRHAGHCAGFLSAPRIRPMGAGLDLVGRHKDGHEFPVDVMLGPLEIDDELAVVGVVRDVTGRRQAEAQIEAQLETLTALYATAQKLPQSLDPQQLAGFLVDSFVRTYGVRLAWLGRAEPDGSLRVLARAPDGADLPEGICTRWDDAPEGQGPAGHALRSGFPEIVHDVGTSGRFPHRLAAWRASGIQAVGAFPLVSRERPYGVLVLYSDRPGFFTPPRVEFFQALAHQGAAALENARLFEETRRHLERLQALRAIDMAVTGSVDLRLTLSVLLDQVTSALGVHAASVLLLDPHTQTLEYAAGRGFRSSAIERSRLRLGEGHAGRAALERRVIALPDLAATGGQFVRAALLAGEEFVSYYAAPLVAKGRVTGVLETFHRVPREPDEGWLEFLEALANQAAIAVDNAALFTALQRSHADLTLAYDTTLEGWSRALDMRDRETEGHTQRVAELTVRLAQALGVSEAEVVHVRRGALLHDIGKMGIPDSVLLKPGPLTDAEWEIMRRHPIYAYELLSPIAYLRPALDIPYCHHEKWDGTGYPRGLRGEQIPLAARIFAVVDVWDALTSERPYRPAWTPEQARQYVQQQAGKHFDPKVVEAFVQLVTPA